jgi:hypothetical protein
MIIAPIVNVDTVFTPPTSFINNSTYGDNDLAISVAQVPTGSTTAQCNVWAQGGSLAYWTNTSQRIQWLFMGHWK